MDNYGECLEILAEFDVKSGEKTWLPSQVFSPDFALKST